MKLLFAYPGNESLAESFGYKSKFEVGSLSIHRFPDGESLVRIETDVRGRDILLLCTLDHPDDKTLPIIFFARTAKELGAKSVTLIAPYLGYMRQDKRFHEGEALTSEIFSSLLSEYFDGLITVDPHLHRHKSMDEIYTIPCKVLHCADTIADWIGQHIKNPVLIGPDEESEQWVAKVAQRAGAPYTVLTKTRHGDKNVKVSVPEIDRYKDLTPVLVDDIISTARTMIETVKHLHKAGMNAPVCIGVHAIFAGDAYEALKAAGVSRIATCNTIPHETNAIDITELLSTAWTT